jgi:hypothetical protein
MGVADLERHERSARGGVRSNRALELGEHAGTNRRSCLRRARHQASFQCTPSPPGTRLSRRPTIASTSIVLNER